MAFQFDKVIDRRNTGSLKWDVKEGELPMWVADMDFMAAPCIREAMEDVISRGVFGYQITTERWAAAYSRWWGERHGYPLKTEGLVFATGVIPVLSSAVRAFSRPNENVVVMTPVYNMFFNCIYNNGRRPLESRLVYEEGSYSIDFKDLEEKLAMPQTSMLFLCNPQNPTGNIWSFGELERIGELAAKYDVIVIADEIHCDITDPGYSYVPFASVSDDCRRSSVTAISPTKAFNIAGLQTAAAYSENATLRHRIWRQLNTDECGEGNVFAGPVAVAAFEEGGSWLDGLCSYIQNNKTILSDFISKELPMVCLVSSHATYLQWIDIRDCLKEGEDSKSFAARLRSSTGLFVSPGTNYRGDGEAFIRLNIACPESVLRDGMERLAKGIRKYS